MKEPIYCPNCGYHLKTFKDVARYCETCGATFEGGEALRRDELTVRKPIEEMEKEGFYPLSVDSNREVTFRLQIQFPSGEEYVYASKLENLKDLEAIQPLPRDREIVPESRIRAEVMKKRRKALYPEIGHVLANTFKEIIEKRDPVNGRKQED